MSNFQVWDLILDIFMHLKVNELNIIYKSSCSAPEANILGNEGFENLIMVMLDL